MLNGFHGGSELSVLSVSNPFHPLKSCCHNSLAPARSYLLTDDLHTRLIGRSGRLFIEIGANDCADEADLLKGSADLVGSIKLPVEHIPFVAGTVIEMHGQAI